MNSDEHAPVHCLLFLLLMLAPGCSDHMDPAEASGWLRSNLPHSFRREMSRAIWVYDTRDVHVGDCRLELTSSLTVLPPNAPAEPHVAHLAIDLAALNLQKTRAVQSGSTNTATVVVAGSSRSAIVKTFNGRITQEAEAPLFFEDASSAMTARSAIRSLAQSCGAR